MTFHNILVDEIYLDKMKPFIERLFSTLQSNWNGQWKVDKFCKISFLDFSRTIILFFCSKCLIPSPIRLKTLCFQFSGISLWATHEIILCSDLIFILFVRYF